MRHWKALLLLAAIAAAALTLVAVAYGEDESQRDSRSGRGGVCGAVVNDPQTAEAMQRLRVEHRRDMRAWWRQYGSDPTSDAARNALRALRQEHMSEMRELLEEAGVDVPDGLGQGCGQTAGRCGGGSGGCGAGPAACGGSGPAEPAGAQGSAYGGMMGGGMMGGGWSY